MNEETILISQTDANGNPVEAATQSNLIPSAGNNWSELISAERLTPEQSASGYNQAADIIKNIADQSNTNIRQQSDNTIGVDRGGQRSLMPQTNDNYMTARYSTPVVENLVQSFKTLGAQQAFTTAANNELEDKQKEAEEAIKARQQRDYQRRLAAQRAAQLAAQQQAQQSMVYGTVNPVADGNELGRDDVGGRAIVDSGIDTGVIGRGIEMPDNAAQTLNPTVNQNQLGGWVKNPITGTQTGFVRK